MPHATWFPGTWIGYELRGYETPDDVMRGVTHFPPGIYSILDLCVTTTDNSYINEYLAKAGGDEDQTAINHFIIFNIRRPKLTTI